MEGSRSDTLTQERIEGARGGSSPAPMPKLLQNREVLERPLDPKELFGGNSGGSREGSLEFDMVGIFGSSVGSYISRVSDPRSSSDASFGEITLPQNTHGPETKDGDEKCEREGVSGESLSAKQEEVKKEGVSGTKKGEETPVTVPSYLAELGVGLGESDLTIDSAFRSLDKRVIESKKESVTQKSQDTAKKLPSIFSFNSTSL